MNRHAIIWIVAAILQFQLMPIGAREPARTDRPTAHIVEIVNFTFLPEELTIRPGDTVTWINRDVVPHNVAAGANYTWRSPNLLKGESFSIVVSAELPYVCSLHEAVMKGMISLYDTP